MEPSPPSHHGDGDTTGAVAVSRRDARPFAKLAPQAAASTAGTTAAAAAAAAALAVTPFFTATSTSPPAAARASVAPLPW